MTVVLNTCEVSQPFSKPMSDSLLQNYKAKHQHPLNRLCHSIGNSDDCNLAAAVFFNWRQAAGFFVVGWILQFVGHAIEGNRPAFFKNPVYLLVGPLWLLRRVARQLASKTRNPPATTVKQPTFTHPNA